MIIHFLLLEMDGKVACKSLEMSEMERQICKGCSRQASDWPPSINQDTVFQVHCQAYLFLLKTADSEAKMETLTKLAIAKDVAEH